MGCCDVLVCLTLTYKGGLEAQGGSGKPYKISRFWKHLETSSKIASMLCDQLCQKWLMPFCQSSKFYVDKIILQCSIFLQAKTYL